MVNHLHLTSDEAIVFALICGYKDGFREPISYIAAWIGKSEDTTRRILRRLVVAKLLSEEVAQGKPTAYKVVANCNPSQIATPRKLQPLANCNPPQIATPPPANCDPPQYIDINNISSSSERVRTCARERLTEWYNASTLPEWTEIQFKRNGLPAIDAKTLLDDFYDNDFKVRERCEQSERMEVLSHFQNWLPKYIHKIKQPNNNGNNNHQTSGQRVTNLEDIARSIMAGCQAGRSGRK